MLSETIIIQYSYAGMFITYDNDAKLSVGSYLGIESFVHGRMYELKLFTPNTAATAANSAGFMTSLSAPCDFNQYVDGSDVCHDCDNTCTRGCDSSGACAAVCHPTCKTCDSDSPGSADECSSCYCGATPSPRNPGTDMSATNTGTCACAATYYGPAQSCTLKCHEGCDECTGTGEHECVRCSKNYHMKPGCFGTCEWCDENACDEDGYPSCGTRGISNPTECDCLSGQWWDGEFCRFCAAGCNTCNVSGNRPVCTQCETGLFRFDGHDECMDFCPFGYTVSGDLCTPHTADYTVYKFEFKPTNDGCQIFEYKDTPNNYLVRVYGGTHETGAGEEVEEPYIFNDRGAWFDGKYDLMTFELLKLPETVIHGFWVKVHS